MVILKSKGKVGIITWFWYIAVEYTTGNCQAGGEDDLPLSLINSELAEYAGLLESELYRIVDELKKKGAEKLQSKNRPRSGGVG